MAKLTSSVRKMKGIDTSFSKDMIAIQKSFNKAFEPLYEFSQQLKTEPFLTFQSETFKFFKRHSEELKKLKFFAEWVKLEDKCKDFCEENDIVLHKVFKKYISQQNDDISFENVIKEWPSIRRDLLQTYCPVDIDKSRRKFFNELLKTFSVGAFSVCRRAAVIEIEGLAVDFCKIHKDRKEDHIKFPVKQIECLPLEDLGGMLIFYALEKYSPKVLLNTETYKHKDTPKPDFSFNRHANAHAHSDVLIATQKDALNAILLLHHYSKYFELLDTLVKAE